MRKCFKCKHKECFGFDWCVCQVCQMIEEYKKTVQEYLKAEAAHEYEKARELKKKWLTYVDEITKEISIKL